MKTMRSEILRITPAFAAEILLKYNTVNPRRVNPRVVHQYAQEMKNGLWVTTHQGIAFSGENLTNPGVLIDGQNRLSAVVESGISLDLFVFFNCPQARKIDFGLKRQLTVVTGLGRADLACAGVVVSAITGCNATPAQKQLLCEAFPGLGEMESLTYHVSTITRAPIHAAFRVAELSGVKDARKWYIQLVENDANMPTVFRFLRAKLEKDFKVLFGGITKKSPAYAAALRAIRAAEQGECLGRYYPDAVLQSIDQYDGVVGSFVRENLV